MIPVGALRGVRTGLGLRAGMGAPPYIRDRMCFWLCFSSKIISPQSQHLHFKCVSMEEEGARGTARSLDLGEGRVLQQWSTFKVSKLII